MKERNDNDTNYEKVRYEALVQQQNAKRLAQALQSVRNQAEIEQSKYETQLRDLKERYNITVSSSRITEGARCLIKVVDGLSKLDNIDVLVSKTAILPKDVENAQFLCKRLLAAESVEQIMKLITVEGY